MFGRLHPRILVNRLADRKARRLLEHISPFFREADQDLREFVGSQEGRNGQDELRDKWNEGSKDPLTYYSQEVGDSYLYDLAFWHSAGDTIPWATTCYPHLRGEVIDFGGGIGSYTLMAGHKSAVRRVYYYDVNQTNLGFTKFRVTKRGTSAKTRFDLPDHQVDCLISLDVLEHLPDRVAAIGEFADLLKPGGVLLLNYTAHTSDGQHPMHLMTASEVGVVEQELGRRFQRVNSVEPGAWRKRRALPPGQGR